MATKFVSLQEGDTLSTISREFGLSIEELKNLNPQFFDFDVNASLTGSTLVIPSTAEPIAPQALSPSPSPSSISPFSIEGLQGTIEGLSFSHPASDVFDLEEQKAQEQRRFDILRSQKAAEFERQIASVREQGVQEQRALGAQLGVGQRFSTSAQAYLKFVEGENQKRIDTLNAQKEAALANLDLNEIEAVNNLIENERKRQSEQNQFVLNLLKIAQSEAQFQAREARLGAPSPFFTGSNIIELMKTIEEGETEEITDPNTGETFVVEGLKKKATGKISNVRAVSDDFGNITYMGIDENNKLVKLGVIRGAGKTKTPKEAKTTPSPGFFSGEIESDVREDFDILLQEAENPQDPTEDDLLSIFIRLRRLYSPQEATDEALASLLGIAPAGTEELLFGNTPLPGEIGFDNFESAGVSTTAIAP